MPITNIYADIYREPRIIRMESTDTIAAIQAKGYINEESNYDDVMMAQFDWQDSDTVRVVYPGGYAVLSVIVEADGEYTLGVSQAVGALVSYDVNITQAELAAAGEKVIVLAQSDSAQYVLRNIMVNGGGTDFSGVVGDRLMSIGDGTSVWTVVPAASMQTLVNGVWGSTGVPLPASVDISTASVAGENIVAAYSGGATDYTAGDVTVTVFVERIA